MKNKDTRVKFNTEVEFDFYAERLNACIVKEEKLKGQQMKKYLETSVLFCPEEVEYSKEELQEKLNKVNKIKSILEQMLGETKDESNC